MRTIVSERLDAPAPAQAPARSATARSATRDVTRDAPLDVTRDAPLDVTRDAPGPRQPDAVAGARAGLRDMLPVTVAVAPLALVLGVAADASVVDNAANVVAAPLIYAGSAHFAVLSALDAGSSAVTAALAALIVNVRFVMYGAALAPRFRGQPGWFRWLAPWTIVDQTFALASLHGAPAPGWFRGYWIASSALLGAGYTAMVGVGVVLGSVIPTGAALDLTVPALFLAMLVGRLRDRPTAVAVLAGGAVTALALELPYSLALPIGALAGAAAAALTRRLTP